MRGKRMKIMAALAALSFGMGSYQVDAVTDVTISNASAYSYIAGFYYDSDTLNASAKTSMLGNSTRLIISAKTAAVSSGSTALVTGTGVYNWAQTEMHNAIASTNYIVKAATTTTGANLSALDTKIGEEQGGNYYDTDDTLEAKLGKLDRKIGVEQSGIYYDADDTLEAKLGKLDTKLGTANTTPVETRIYNLATQMKILQEVTDATSGGAKSKVQTATLTLYGEGEPKTVTVAGEGDVAAGDLRLLSGATLYTYLHASEDGTYHYIGAGQTVSANLMALDAALGAVESDDYTFIKRSLDTADATKHVSMAENLVNLDTGIAKLISYEGSVLSLGGGYSTADATAVSLGSRKLTGLANGTANTDAAAYGKLAKKKDGGYEFQNGVATIETNASTEAAPKTAFILSMAGEIARENAGFITGGQLATELRPATSGQTVAASLSDLDSKTYAQVSSITDNAGKIATNSAAIQTNKAAIEVNTAAIETNKEAIAVNTAAIQTNKDAIKANTDAIEENTKAIAENTKAIAENAEAIQGIRADISEKFGAIDKQIKESQDAVKAINDKIGTISADTDTKVIDKTATISANLMALDEKVKGAGVDLLHIRNVTKVQTAKANDVGAIALGAGSNASGVHSISFGTEAAASAGNAIAMGNGARATFADAVAIGSGSTATEKNVVSVGSKGSERKVTNVAPGVNETDAVTVKQLMTFVNEDFEAFRVAMSGPMLNEVYQVAAGSAALSALHPESYHPQDKFSVAVGFGHYRNSNFGAGAIGAFYKPRANATFSIGGTLGDSDSLLNMGVSFTLRHRDERLLDAGDAALTQRLRALRQSSAALLADQDAQQQELASIRAENAKIQGEQGKLQKQINQILSWMDAVETSDI